MSDKNYYSIDTIRKIVEDQDKVVMIEDDKDHFLVKYSDLPDYIFSNKSDIAVFDVDSDPTQPILTTNGTYLNKCDKNVRTDIIDRLNDLQQHQIKPHKVKKIDLSEYAYRKFLYDFDNKKHIKTFFGDEIIQVSSYLNGNNLAIMLCDRHGGEDCLTINLNGYPLAIDEGFISDDVQGTYPDHKTLPEIFKEEGIIKQSYGFFPFNMGKYEKVKFDLPKLREYDPKGVDSYLKQFGIDKLSDNLEDIDSINIGI